MARLYRSVYPFLSVTVLGIVLVSLAIQVDGVIAKKTAIVQTSTGFVQGEVLSETLYRFSGIPFAEPPVGNLRFEPPVKKKTWVGILDATKQRSRCVQGDGKLQSGEDCLHLKIYTSKAPDKSNKLPVIVWIHGGAFFIGDPDLDDTHPEHLLNEGVIIVNIHYRLGLFGFISTGDSVAPGNVGLKDQIMALEWIKENILHFGGDPEKITILGQSAGSTSIAYLLQAPQTKGLYRAAIMLSGSSLNTWSLVRDPLTFATSVARTLKVSTKNHQQMVEELKKIPAEEIHKATVSQFSKDLVSNPLGGLPLGPVTEPEHPDAIISKRSHDLLKEGHFNEVPILMGHTSLEAYSKDGLSDSIKLLLATFGFNPARMVPVSLRITNPLEKIWLGEEIKLHYFGLSGMTDSLSCKWISEDQFVRGIYEAVRLYSQKVPVYYYNFAYEGTLSGIHNRHMPGVGHTEDLYYIFNFGREGSKTDYLVRDRLVRMITNFAKYKNPTPTEDQLLQNMRWPANVGGNDIKQLNVTEVLDIVTNPNSNNMGFWKNIFDKHGQKSVDTY